jgi:hypothetical protein
VLVKSANFKFANKFYFIKGLPTRKFEIRQFNWHEDTIFSSQHPDPVLRKTLPIGINISAEAKCKIKLRQFEISNCLIMAVLRLRQKQ